MRVIAGSRRSMPLKTIDGIGTRPTQDRTKETLFNVLQQNIPGCVFLDLFSGSGAIGIEALSRGAEKAYFVENNRAALGCIKENIAFTKFTPEEAIVMETDALTALRRLEGREEQFDVIFMDPPYNNEHEKQVLEYLKDAAYVTEETMIVVEASDQTEFDYLGEMGFTIEKVKQYKTNMHVFIRKEQES